MSEVSLLPQKLESIKIDRVKRNKETNKLEVRCSISYHNPDHSDEEAEDVFAEFVVSPDFSIHDDLNTLFTELGIHLAFVADQLDTNDYSNTFFNHVLEGGTLIKADAAKVIKSIIATYIIFDKDEEKCLIHIGGQRKLANGNILNMHCSNVRYKTTENYNYDFRERLENCIGNFQDEVQKYLYGKCKPGAVQLELFELPVKKSGRKKKNEEVAETD